MICIDLGSRVSLQVDIPLKIGFGFDFGFEDESFPLCCFGQTLA
jgi:hypothetical protein